MEGECDWQAQPEQDLEQGELLGDEEPMDHKQQHEDHVEVVEEGMDK